MFPYPLICCNSSYVYVLKPSYSLAQELSEDAGFHKSSWVISKMLISFGTKCPFIFCVGSGPLQLGVVLFPVYSHSPSHFFS